MKSVLILGALFVAQPALAGPQDNVCNSDGKQTTLNGKTHTCGTCPSGGGNTTAMWFVGDLEADTAVKACECYTDKSSGSCTKKVNEIIAATDAANRKAPPARSPAR